MAKTKKNRAGLSEKIAIKSQKKKAEKLNPFDVRFVNIQDIDEFLSASLEKKLSITC